MATIYLHPLYLWVARSRRDPLCLSQPVSCG